MFRVYQFLVLYVVVSTGLPVYYFQQRTGGISPVHVALSFFCTLNILICLWEMALGWHITHIKKTSKNLTTKYKNTPLVPVMHFFFCPLGLADIFSGKFWSIVWSTYSLYDPSYANRESFGFFIDVGNGWTTIIPSLLVLMGITSPALIAEGGVLPFAITPQVLGIIGILKFYQEFYGTVIYFLSFFLNGRHHGKSVLEVSLFVGLSNGLWFFFPLLGMYVCAQMIMNNEVVL